MFLTRLLALALAATAAATPLVSRQIRCAKGLYIIAARGSYQPKGEGTVGPVADMIEARIPGSYSVAVDYPAVVIGDGDTYFSSVIDGINDARKKVEAYVAACGANSRIVLVGYSQGAEVMTDLLAGGTGKPAPLAEKYRKNIVGAAVFGDPRFNAKQPIDAGTSTSNGIFARTTSLARLNTFSKVLRSYCDEGDPFCSSDFNLLVHFKVVEKYAQAAADFIVGVAS